MKYIVSGTNRPGSRTLEVCRIVERTFRESGQDDVEILDLARIPLNLLNGAQYGQTEPREVFEPIARVNTADGLVIVCPEYNGSMPGALKYFIDHWKYPESFEFRPVAFIGLGGRYGGLRPVEHLQQVFGYRNAFIYPERVFLSNIWTTLKDGELHDPTALDLIRQQAIGFGRFVAALRTAGLDAEARKSKASSVSR